MDVPLGLIEVAIEPKSRADHDALVAALAGLVAVDPLMRVYTDRESGLTIIAGTSESQLDAKIDILKRTYKVEANIGAPQVAYRETLGKRSEIDYTHKRQTGGTGQFARLKIVFEPGKSGSGFVFASEVVEGAVPKRFIPGVIKGLESAKENGLLAGFPVSDFSATLIDGAFHDVDSSILAFEIASRAAFRELRERGEPKITEPIMKVEVVIPVEYMGDMIADLNRRGWIQGSETRGDSKVVTALVSLANMLGYVSYLRGISEGRAKFTMQYDHHEPVEVAPSSGPDLFPPAAAMRA